MKIIVKKPNEKAKVISTDITYYCVCCFFHCFLSA